MLHDPPQAKEATESDTLLTVDHAAERLGMSVRFVRQLIAERRIATSGSLLRPARRPAYGLRTFPSKADANRHLAQVEADLLRGAWTDPRLARITFGEWAERWWPTTADLPPGTRTFYDYLL